MLPSTNEFDHMLEQIDGPLAKIKLAGELGDRARELALRAGRARCLALLQVYEQFPAGRHRRYHDIATMTGLSINRVSQLLADARVWRESERG